MALLPWWLGRVTLLAHESRQSKPDAGDTCVGSKERIELGPVPSSGVAALACDAAGSRRRCLAWAPAPDGLLEGNIYRRDPDDQDITGCRIVTPGIPRGVALFSGKWGVIAGTDWWEAPPGSGLCRNPR